MNATARVYQFPTAVSDPVGSRQMKAQDLIDRLTELVKQHGNLRVDGIEELEYWKYSSEEKLDGWRDYFLAVTGCKVEIY
jgi:hypothetical protein